MIIDSEKNYFTMPTLTSVKIMNMIKRCLDINFYLDTNRINARQNIKELNILEGLNWRGAIKLKMPLPAQNEAMQGDNKRRIEKACSNWAPIPFCETEDEKQMWVKIRDIVFPDYSGNENEKTDIDILFTVWKYHAIFITRDGESKRQPGGILGARNALDSLSIKVMTEIEALDFVKKKLKERDKLAIRRAEIMNSEIPSWVEEDLKYIEQADIGCIDC